MATDIKVKGRMYRFSRHACKRLDSREITREEVINLIENPAKVRINTCDKSGDTQHIYMGTDRLTACIDEKTGIIKTIYRNNLSWNKSRAGASKNEKEKRVRGRKNPRQEARKWKTKKRR